MPNIALPDQPAAASPHPDATTWLVRGVTHDLNNALAVITGCGFQLDEHFTKNSAARELVRALDDAVANAGRVARRLAAITRRASHRHQTLALGDVVTRVLTHQRALLGCGVVCAADLADDGVRVNADEGQLELALLSVVLGARDVMPDGGRIRFHTRRGEVTNAGSAWAELAVHVAPAGAALEDVPGVALLRSVAARLGGSVVVESDSDSGTRIVFGLPAVAEQGVEFEDQLVSDDSAA